MAAKKTKRRGKNAASSKKATARKVGMGRKRLGGFAKHVAKELTIGPIKGDAESIVDAARRLWLSASSLIASPAASLRKSARKTRRKASS